MPRKKKPEDYIWTPKKGEPLWMSEMEDQHLINAYKFVMRQLVATNEEANACWSMSFQGEMAQYYQDVDINRLSNEAAELQDMADSLYEWIVYKELEVPTSYNK